MIETLVFFIPVYLCAFWILVHLLLARRSKTFKVVVLLLAGFSGYLLYDSCLASPLTPYPILANVSLAVELIGPSLIPLLVYYIDTLHDKDHMRTGLFLWFIIAGALLSANIILFHLLPPDEIEEFIKTFYNNGLSTIAEYKGTGVYYFALWYAVGYMVVITSQLIMYVGYLIRLRIDRKYSFHNLWGFLFRGAEITPAQLQLTVSIPIIILLVIRATVSKNYLDSNPAVNITGSVILILLICMFAYIALFGSAKMISFRKMDASFRYNVHEDVPEEEKPVAVSAPMPLVRHSLLDELFPKDRVLNEDDGIRIRFERMLLEDKVFLSAKFSLDDAAIKMHTNKTYISNLTNRVYHTGFPDILNTLRVDHAQKYMLAHRDARQEEVARSSGFLSASAFNITFKKVTGVTPKVWLGAHDMNDE